MPSRDPGQRHVCFRGRDAEWMALRDSRTARRRGGRGGSGGGSPGTKGRQAGCLWFGRGLATGSDQDPRFQEWCPYKALRELARKHRMVVRDVVRTKNRIKSMYRSRGVAVAGKSVYSSAGREPWQEQLPEACRGPVRTLYAELDALEEVRNDRGEGAGGRKHASSPSQNYSRLVQVWARFVRPSWFPSLSARIVSAPSASSGPTVDWGIVMRSSSDWVRDKNGQWQRAQVHRLADST